MGGYLLYNIRFSNKEMRDKFEKQEKKLRRMFQYKDDDYDCTYYPTWEGYGEPLEIIKKCKRNKIKIDRFLSIDLSTQSNWFDEIKQESYVEEEE